MTEPFDLPDRDPHVPSADRKYLETKVIAQKRIAHEKGLCRSSEKCRRCVHGPARRLAIDAARRMLRSAGVQNDDVLFAAIRFFDVFSASARGGEDAGRKEKDAADAAVAETMGDPAVRILIASYVAVKCVEVDFDTTAATRCFRYICDRVAAARVGGQDDAGPPAARVRSLELRFLGAIGFDLATAGTPMALLADMTGWGSSNPPGRLARECLCLSNQRLQVLKSLRYLVRYYRDHCCFECDPLDLAFAVQQVVRDSPFVYTLSIPRYLVQESAVDLAEVSRIADILTGQPESKDGGGGREGGGDSTLK